MSCDNTHVAQVHEIMRSHSCLTAWEIAKECNILIGSCHDILTTKLEMHWVASKFVPRLLTQDQRGSQVANCQEHLDRASEDENFLKRIITSDETWVYGYDMETKIQSSQWAGKKNAETKSGRSGQT
jgi:hypothetical protein